MPHVLDWKRADDPRDVVHLAVQALAEGHLVAFPTDTLYNIAASALHPEAVRRLTALASKNPAARITLAMRSATEASDYATDLSPVANRILQRVWPGPLAIVVKPDAPTSLLSRLPIETQKCILDSEGWLTLRAPSHEVFEHIAYLSSGPLVLLAAPEVNASQPISADFAKVPEVALAIDDGVTHYQGPSTCIRVDSNRCSILSPGVLDEEALRSYGQFTVLIVCTGNTCRSPMAERLLQAKFHSRFESMFEEGKLAPIATYSAGVSAMSGGRASSEAIMALQGYGLDLKNHQSSPVTERVVRKADLILTMTNNHRNALLSRWPHLESKTHLLAVDGGDVSDPFGCNVDVYRACAAQIDHYLEQWADQISENSLAVWPKS